MAHKFFIAIFLVVLPLFSDEQFKWGGELRSDFITLRNVPAEFSRQTGETLPELNIFRQRIELWGETKLSEKATLRLGVMNEFREYFDGETPDKDYSPPSEFILKTAYFDYQFTEKISLRVGRQDIKYGAGRIIWDPNPFDGSRTSFFDAAKLSWAIDKTKLDLTIFKNNNFNDYALNDEKRPLALNDVQGVLFYGQNKQSDSFNFDLYYMFTDEDEEDQRTTHTLGTRLLPQFTELISGDFELAFQRGKFNNIDQQGLLLYNSLKVKTPQVSCLDYFKFGFYHLSGDDPNTDKNEAWNGTFAGWPQFSTLAVIAASGSEQGKARIHNISSPFLEIGIPIDKGSLRLSYWKMLADTNSDSSFDKDKGDLFVLKYGLTIKEGLLFEISTEYMQPGDYYPDNIDDSLYMRIRLKYTF